MLLSVLRILNFILVLDYNHEKIEWIPSVPESMRTFYDSFLRWRAEAGMDNCIADNLPLIFKRIGLQNITLTEQFELARKTDEDVSACRNWL